MDDIFLIQTLMKKIYPSFLFMVIISITLWSCNQIEPIIAEENAIASLDFFSQYGDVHNAMLAHVDKNIVINKQCKTKEDVLNYLMNTQSKYAEELLLPDSDKCLIQELLPVYKHLYDKENILKSATIIQYTIKGRFMSR